jgi:hypothetical protein
LQQQVPQPLVPFFPGRGAASRLVGACPQPIGRYVGPELRE